MPSFLDEAGRLRPGHDAVAPVERLIEDCDGRPDRLIAALARHGIPAAAAAPLVARLAHAAATAPEWHAAIERSREKGERLRAAASLTEAALAPIAGRVALPASALGPAWSSDVDVLVPDATLDSARELLLKAGFLELELLLQRLGRVDREVRRFAAVAGAEVLASVELCLRLHAFGPPAAEAVARGSAPAGGGLRRLAASDAARRRCAKVAARRRVVLRDLLELAALRETAGGLPGGREVAVAARRCARLASGPHRGGREPPGRAWPAPTAGWARSRVDGTRVRIARRVRPRRVVVAFTGIDGSGKSTQAAAMVAMLGRVSIPAAATWTRVGFGGSRPLAAVARAGQRLLPNGSHSAQRARATAATAPAGPLPLTRRGPLGWCWSLAVVVDYVWRARVAARRVRGGVVVLDRALTDALVDLEQGFGGALDLRPHRRLIERAAPRPDVTFHLRLSGAAAHARKADLFTVEVLERYASRFDSLVAARDGVVVLDAETDPAELALTALRIVAAQNLRSPAASRYDDPAVATPPVRGA